MRGNWLVCSISLARMTVCLCVCVCVSGDGTLPSVQEWPHHQPAGGSPSRGAGGGGRRGPLWEVEDQLQGTTHPLECPPTPLSIQDIYLSLQLYKYTHVKYLSWETHIYIYIRGGTVHKIHGSVRFTVLWSRFSVRFGICWLLGKSMMSCIVRLKLKEQSIVCSNRDCAAAPLQLPILSVLLSVLQRDAR